MFLHIIVFKPCKTHYLSLYSILEKRINASVKCERVIQSGRLRWGCALCEHEEKVNENKILVMKSKRKRLLQRFISRCEGTTSDLQWIVGKQRVEVWVRLNRLRMRSSDWHLRP
jgi:hypothetical protein